MKILSAILIVLGLLMAPAYWIYAKFYTGNQAMMLDLKAGAHDAKGHPVWQTEVFQLSPDMAPAGLLILAQGHFAPNMDESRPPQDLYLATLSHNGVAAKPLGFSLGVKSVSDTNPVFREHLLLMQSIQKGDFQLQITSHTPPGIVIDRLQLQVRQHIHEPDPGIVMAGIITFVLGILGLVIS